MSLRRQLAQLLVLRASGYALDQQRRYPRWELSNDELQRGLAEGVGGVILLGGSAADLALRCQQLQSWAQGPLLLCADVDRRAPLLSPASRVNRQQKNRRAKPRLNAVQRYPSRSG